MLERKQSNAPTARVLALLVLLALIAVAVVPASPPAYAGPGGGNDTIHGAPSGDSGTVPVVSFESAYYGDVTASAREGSSDNWAIALLLTLVKLMPL